MHAIIAMIFGFIFRMLAIWRHWEMPKFEYE